ncbi:MAG: NAD(P)H-quinone oxidoreductase [Chloroflexi bacterium]|nr:MAG: NADPH:quinone oxidoreductase [Phototrophicales bacterium]RMF77891.1 MAG: NAD(P)H-quinone oxidoreductase [Chloroflexota bacterium]
MRAVIAQDKKPTIVELPDLSPSAGELLVQVKATALNRADLLQVQGNYPPPAGAPEILGLEFAGEIIAVGDGVRDYTIGQRVMALVAGGGYAEQAVVPAAHTMPIPDYLSYEEAAAIPEAFLTAFSNMVEIGRLKAGETVLIHAGASGVGLAAIQIAKVIGATVVVTTSAAKHGICREYGADITIDYKSENFAERLLAENIGVDLIIEHVGAPYWNDNMRVLNLWGRVVYIGLLGGALTEVNLSDIMRKRLSIMGSTLRNRTFDEKAGLISRFWEWAQPHFESGTLKPTVWRTMPLDDVVEAHELMASNANAGKIVLTL